MVWLLESQFGRFSQVKDVVTIKSAACTPRNLPKLPEGLCIQKLAYRCS